MAEETKEPCKCSTVQIIDAITKLVGALCAAGGLAFGVTNYNSIHEGRAEAKEKAVEVKQTLVETTKQQEETLKDLTTSAKVVEDTIGPTLLASWKYIQQVADETKLPKDIDAANKAKKAYDDFVAKHKGR